MILYVQKDEGANCWLYNALFGNVDNCDWEDSGGPPDPLGGYCEIDEEAKSQYINECINACGEYHEGYPTICSDACNGGESADCSNIADVDFPQNYCYDSCIEIHDGDSNGCSSVCDVENSSSQCVEQSNDLWTGSSGDVCYDNNTSSCSNHGELPLRLLRRRLVLGKIVGVGVKTTGLRIILFVKRIQDIGVG